MKSNFGCRRNLGSKLLPYYVVVVLLFLTVGVSSHARIECPPPLSGKTGEKNGPCDVSSDDGSVHSFPLKANALNTITWLESVPHPGAPVRFALSREGGGPSGSLTEVVLGFESCLLLDHIPHDALARPVYSDQSSYHRSSITLWIPDVQCDRCYLQLISIMSDAPHGVPADTKCAYGGALANDPGLAYPACPSVYHSCSPVSIDGNTPRDDIDVCDTAEFEEKIGWPLTSSDSSDLYQHSVYYNRGDVGLYDGNNATLVAVGAPLTDDTCASATYCDPSVSFQEKMLVPEDASYASLEGTCASVTETEVEEYVTSSLTNKDEDEPIISKDAEKPSITKTDEAQPIISSGSLVIMTSVPTATFTLLVIFFIGR